MKTEKLKVGQSFDVVEVLKNDVNHNVGIWGLILRDDYQFKCLQCSCGIPMTISDNHNTTASLFLRSEIKKSRQNNNN